MSKALTKLKTNPNGANQYQLDPRQLICWEYFIDPLSLTFSNAYASAIKAGYTEGSATKITTENWFVEKVRRMNMLDKAERNLDEVMDLPSKTQAMGAFGPIFEKVGKGKKAIKIPVMTFNTGLLKVKNDASKFVAERLGRKKYGDDEKDKPQGVVVNFTKIIINAPNATKGTEHKSDSETVRSMAGSQ